MRSPQISKNAVFHSSAMTIHTLWFILNVIIVIASVLLEYDKQQLNEPTEVKA